MEDEKLGRYDTVLSVRVSPHTDFLISKRASELDISKSEVAREIITRYFDGEIKDPELIYSSLNDTKDKIRNLNTSLTLISVMLMEQYRHLLKVLPNRSAVPDEIADIEYQDFVKNCRAELNKHKGMFDSWVLESLEGVMN